MAAPTDTFQLLQWNMIHAHGTFKLGYDIILSHLQEPPKDDLKNFLGYCEAWAASIDSHHESEEDVVFPFLNGKMDFSGEAEQHKVIHDRLDSVLAMIREAQKDHSKFNPAELNNLLTALKEPLFAHLDEEVDHIAAPKLKEAGFTENDVLAMLARMDKYVKSHGDPFVVVPYMRSHTPADVKDFWPPMPWILRKLVVPYVLAKKYSGYWKYSPYNMS